ncbi:MAG: hypothetical protein IT204_23845 [Fimbriimonadaceae bacterium]|nr:hypothetical protein [Fimbriimonadaceae bacterium]
MKTTANWATATVACLVLATGAGAQSTATGPLAPGQNLYSQPISVTAHVHRYGTLSLFGSTSQLNVTVPVADLAAGTTSWKRAPASVIYTVSANVATTVTEEAVISLANPATTTPLLAETTITVPANARLGFINPPVNPPLGSIRGVIVKPGTTTVTVNAWAKPPGGSWNIEDRAGTYTGTIHLTVAPYS